MHSADPISGSDREKNIAVVPTTVDVASTVYTDEKVPIKVYDKLILRLHVTCCHLLLQVTVNDEPFLSNTIAYSKLLEYAEKPLALAGAGRRHNFSQ